MLVNTPFHHIIKMLIVAAKHTSTVVFAKQDNKIKKIFCCRAFTRIWIFIPLLSFSRASSLSPPSWSVVTPHLCTSKELASQSRGMTVQTFPELFRKGYLRHDIPVFIYYSRVIHDLAQKFDFIPR
jgi:hypothetical protein